MNLGAYYLVGIPFAMALTFVYGLGGKVMFDFLLAFFSFFSFFFSELDFVEFVCRVCGWGLFVGVVFKQRCF